MSSNNLNYSCDQSERDFEEYSNNFEQIPGQIEESGVVDLRVK